MIFQIVLILVIAFIVYFISCSTIFYLMMKPPHRNYRNLPVLLFNKVGNVELVSLMNVYTWKDDKAMAWAETPIRLTNKKAFIGEVVITKYSDVHIKEYQFKPTKSSKIIKTKKAANNIAYFH